MNFSFESDSEAFKINVKKCVENCDKKKYDNPPINSDDSHAIRFSYLDEQKFKEVKQSILNSIQRS